MVLRGPERRPASGGPAKQLVVLCHGVGADGNDLIGLADYWAQVLPDAQFVAPDGPEPYDMAPAGFGGRQWFSIGDLDPATLGDGVRRAQIALDAFIDLEIDRLGIRKHDYALMGFSQGAMTVLFTGLRRKVPPKAILAYSGALIDPESLTPEITGKPPVLLVHGENDAVVPSFRSRAAANTLMAAGVPVQTLCVPGLGHGIEQDGLKAGANTLRQAFEYHDHKE